MFPSFVMRSMPIALLACASLFSASSFIQACKKSESGPPGGDGGLGLVAAPPDASADIAPDAGAVVAAGSAAASVARSVVHPSGPPAAGNGCTGKEASACAPGGFEELACVSGVWKVAQVCRGPGACKADGAGVHCDPGPPAAGDPCAESAAPRCASVHTVFACKGGTWESSMCVPPGKCVPNAKNGVAGCK
jgi:hypothetical protein